MKNLLINSTNEHFKLVSEIITLEATIYSKKEKKLSTRSDEDKLRRLNNRFELTHKKTEQCLKNYS